MDKNTPKLAHEAYCFSLPELWTADVVLDVGFKIKI